MTQQTRGEVIRHEVNPLDLSSSNYCLFLSFSSQWFQQIEDSKKNFLKLQVEVLFYNQYNQCIVWSERKREIVG